MSLICAGGSCLRISRGRSSLGLRSPLREVLHRRAGDGYVPFEKNRGTTAVSMDLSMMRVCFQTASLVFSSIAKQAAENRTSRQVADLKEPQGEFARAIARDRPDPAAWGSVA
ncbi:hypothetical protein KX928_00585 [Roseobacter sp. YSTF-M11]|uniref:Uncharacterized protein n=1 Tax=Roseobacter insulae TaxID=2859783 RepID=A0A9X1JWK9_9RHOB|nr:hypothetical protein [Roseobacter insulae]MBW4706275.1 hypothetical protein [Roseobacter insulae]